MAVECGSQAAAVERAGLARALEPEQVDQGRDQVRGAHDPAHTAGGPIREPEQEGHVQLLLVEERVTPPVVIAQALAVIGDDGDQGALALAALVEEVEQPAELRVEERDLGVVDRDQPVGRLVRARREAPGSRPGDAAARRGDRSSGPTRRRAGGRGPGARPAPSRSWHPPGAAPCACSRPRPGTAPGPRTRSPRPRRRTPGRGRSGSRRGRRSRTRRWPGRRGASTRPG